MKRSILFFLVFLFVLSFSLSSALAQDTTTFPYLKPPNHLSPRYVIKLADGELIRSATSREDMQTLVGSIFGADTYFKDLNSSAHRKELYKQVLREIVLMNVLEQDRKWLSYLTAANEKTQLSLDLLDPEAMGDFFSLYRALIDNRYLPDNNLINKSLNYLKQFGRMDTKITKSWWQTIEKLKLHQNTLDKVGKTLSFTSFISSIGSITLSAMEAMNQEIAYQHLLLISETLKDMEGQGEYFNPDFKQALIELTKENDDLINTSFISDFTKNFYYEWEKNKDTVTEKGLALFMDTTGKKIITTTLKKAGLSNAALPALAWSLSIQFSYHVIQSGLKGIDLFHRYVITSDTLFWLRKMRDYAYANQDDSYLSFNLLDATSQLYAYQLLESLMNTTPQKLMFWKLGTRKLVLAEITSTQEELRSLFPGVPEVVEKPEMLTWEKTFGGSKDDCTNSIIQTSDGGYVVAGDTESKGAGKYDAWVIKLDNEGNKVWDKTYGGRDYDWADLIIQTTDGGYAIAGVTYSKSAGKSDFWVIKLDNQGNIIWEKTYGGRDDDWAYSIIQTTDGGYVIAGKTESKVAGVTDAWIIKLDHEGNIIWDQTYGGSGCDVACFIIQTIDGVYIVAGITNFYDIWVIKIDDEGSIIWDNTLKTSGLIGWSLIPHLIKTTDGGYAIAAETYSKSTDSQDAWVIKLDENGNKGETLKEEIISKDTLNKTYALGDTGPAGGYIFYDKGSYSDGWRYLEAAPASTGWYNKKWGSRGTFIGGTEIGIGTGKSNTTIIVTWLNSHGETDRAAQLCDALVYGGCSDWFLPSKDELNLIYKNPRITGVGAFTGRFYCWSSSEGGAGYAWLQFFHYDNPGLSDKNDNARVRAVRAF